jgi:hypothetical protein
MNKRVGGVLNGDLHIHIVIHTGSNGHGSKMLGRSSVLRCLKGQVTSLDLSSPTQTR